MIALQTANCSLCLQILRQLITVHRQFRYYTPETYPHRLKIQLEIRAVARPREV